MKDFVVTRWPVNFNLKSLLYRFSLILFNPSSLSFTLARIEILCGEKALYFKAEPSDLNGWPARKIRVGKCRLNAEYTVSADYEECGLMVAESGNELNMISDAFL